MKRFTLICSVLAAAAALAAATRPLDAANPGLTVHEWGTFTSVAAPNGQAVDWRPLSGPQDLPCFVTELTPQTIQMMKFVQNGNWLKSMFATVRMETPVLYFYSPDETTVDVRVRFPHGFITEWYPAANVPKPLANLRPSNGAIEWKGVKVRPNGDATFPTEPGASHYYAARNTDAAPLAVGTQREKFLFYRGLASFTPPISARFDADGTIAITNAGGAYPLIVFENRRGKIGYRIEEMPGASTVVARPALDKNVDALRADLKSLLVKEGLYPREAAAMVDTWRDSWFEEGARVFYLMPRAAVDALLPLEITPAPSQVARAFVGRVEMLTTDMLDQVERAFLANDLDTLNRYGRFLEPIAQQLSMRPAIATRAAEIRKALEAVVSSHPPRACR